MSFELTNLSPIAFTPDGMHLFSVSDQKGVAHWIRKPNGRLARPKYFATEHEIACLSAGICFGTVTVAVCISNESWGNCPLLLYCLDEDKWKMVRDLVNVTDWVKLSSVSISPCGRGVWSTTHIDRGDCFGAELILTSSGIDQNPTTNFYQFPIYENCYGTALTSDPKVKVSEPVTGWLNAIVIKGEGLYLFLGRYSNSKDPFGRDLIEWSRGPMLTDKAAVLAPAFNPDNGGIEVALASGGVLHMSREPGTTNFVADKEYAKDLGVVQGITSYFYNNELYTTLKANNNLHFFVRDLKTGEWKKIIKVFDDEEHE